MKVPTPGSIPISVIIMTINEERVLEHTLKSVAPFAQVFVVDSHSTDRTLAIAEEHHAKVVQFTWDGGYPKKKEWALLNLDFTYDWVLYLDADEMVTPRLAAELSALMQGRLDHAAYDVELDYWFLGRMLRHGHRVTKRVLLDRTRSAWPHVDDLGVKNMWEVEGHYQPMIDGSIGRLTGTLHHNDRDPLFDYFARHNRYSDWEAHLAEREALAKSVQGVRTERGKRYARVPFKPLAFFFYSYVARRGFLDGRAGFHYAVAHAFYFWQISAKRREIALLNREQTIDLTEVPSREHHQ
ncbi:glycosyltransferase family 2 protein [Kineosporia sp. NBRC 101731]|uniref:glycosyltransferase family 2 protein n=1 Tax=Kineosporia sp. NBRC 101731 TaxID=3032199 RepID=UPI0024A2FFF9|nr:glycosyltransferase family 2 protein [Kineosporia sp. NBRC 101731]GLY29855.1 beta 1,4 glucosyltransferase [Kineosporia sp. NBRC 101731]